jgi:two-component system, OmpR family, response regulator VicR
MAKILIVEDDPRLKMTYDVILKKEGHEVECALDGEEALQKAESFQPDIILLDMMLPKVDGIEFLERFDLHGKHPATKVVVFSNLEKVDELNAAYKLGASRYMLKSSTSPKELAALIERTLSP